MKELGVSLQLHIHRHEPYKVGISDLPRISAIIKLEIPVMDELRSPVLFPARDYVAQTIKEIGYE